MAMRNPLDQFAARIIRQGETAYFIQGLLDLGVHPSTIQNVLDKSKPKPDNYDFCCCGSGKMFGTCCGVTKPT